MPDGFRAVLTDDRERPFGQQLASRPGIVMLPVVEGYRGRGDIHREAIWGTRLWWSWSGSRIAGTSTSERLEVFPATRSAGCASRRHSSVADRGLAGCCQEALPAPPYGSVTNMLLSMGILVKRRSMICRKMLEHTQYAHCSAGRLCGLWSMTLTPCKVTAFRFFIPSPESRVPVPVSLGAGRRDAYMCFKRQQLKMTCDCDRTGSVDWMID